MSERPTPAIDAAMVLGMASTAIPFADSREAEAERWLRLLRLHGHAGAALQALGVSEAPLEGHAEHALVPPDASGRDPRDVVESVGARATAAAERRGGHTVETGDVLLAVMEEYGEDFDRVLRAHGTDRDEVLERLALEAV